MSKTRPGAIMPESTDQSLKALAKELGLSKKKISEFKKSVRAGERKIRPLVQKSRRAEIVTEEDLSVRINVRDYD
jgi:hypothetical protein